MKTLMSLMLSPFMYPEGDAAGGSGGASGDLNAGGTPGAAGDTNAGDTTGTKGTQGANGRQTGPTPGSTGGDDDPRIKGMLADLQRERQARQKYEADLKASNAELDRERKRVRAALGVDAPNAEEAEAEQIRAQFRKVITPDVLAEAMGLSKEDLAAIKEYREQAPQFRSAVEQQWEKHGIAMVDGVTAEVAKAYGGELTERQKQRIAAVYVQEATQNPEFLARHQAGDPKLITEFAKEFVDDWVEPTRRNVLAAELGRTRRVPDGRGRSTTPGGGGKKIDFSDPKAVEDAMVESYKSHGGVFGD
jgi:hypothetical protein